MIEESKPPAVVLREIVQAQKHGAATGIYSVCSANRFVLEACMKLALQDGTRLLIESTSNQVNQYGGYTGMTPARFVEFLGEVAASAGFPPERLILGGDHLGPNPWASESASSAMAKARQLVRDCVKAGYTKIHLDASMPLGEERAHLPLDRQISAERAAELCLAAEQALDDSPGPTRLVYVIGTEVPPPGGSTEKEEQIEVTRVEDALETIEVTRAAFHARRLEHAWDRVIAMVVQPGVEFGDDRLFEYERSRAAGLSRFIEGVPGLVYEAHSTDYQDREALKRMVEDHFAILKVGPALTFAFREAVFALAMLENELLGEKEDPQRSGVIEALEAAMLRDPGYWKAYYRGDKAQSRLARKYSPSDRIRYYWAVPEVARVLKRLLENLERRPIPASLISQFLPVQYGHLRQGRISSRPIDLIYDKVWETAQDYAWACRSS